jgi:hypothetical protein
VSRATALLIGSTLALSLVACGSEESSPLVATGAGPSPTAAGGESPIAGPAASVVPSCGPTTTDESGGLTGVWEADDDGIYYLRETGDGRLWWFGTDVGRTTGNTFSNVAVGQIDGDVIRLEWADVPYGTWLNRGNLTLQLSADGHTLTKTQGTGGFGGSTWTLLIKCSSPGASASPRGEREREPLTQRSIERLVHRAGRGTPPSSRRKPGGVPD